MLIHPTSRSGKLLPVTTGIRNNRLTASCSYPNCGPDFIYYQFNTTISAKDGISSFTVEIVDDASGKTIVYENGGSGFPFSDAIQPVFSLSNQSVITVDKVDYTQLNITALVGLILYTL